MSRHLDWNTPLRHGTSSTSASQPQNDNIRFELDLGLATTNLNLDNVSHSPSSFVNLESDFKLKLIQTDWQARLKFYNDKKKFNAIGLALRPEKEIQNDFTFTADSVFGSFVYSSSDLMDMAISETGVWFTRGRQLGNQGNWELFWAAYVGAQTVQVKAGNVVQSQTQTASNLLKVGGYHAESKALTDISDTSLEKTTPMSRINFGTTRKLSSGFGISAQASIPVALNVKGIDIKMFSYRVGIVVSPKLLKENILENL